MMHKSRINRPDAKQLFLDGDGRGAKAGGLWTGGQPKQVEERQIFTLSLNKDWNSVHMNSFPGNKTLGLQGSWLSTHCHEQLYAIVFE